MELSAGIKACLFWHSLSSQLRARSHRFGSLHSMVIKWPCNISFFCLSFLSLQVLFSEYTLKLQPQNHLQKLLGAVQSIDSTLAERRYGWKERSGCRGAQKILTWWKHRKSDCWELQDAPSFSYMTSAGFERRNLSNFLSSSISGSPVKET